MLGRAESWCAEPSQSCRAEQDSRPRRPLRLQYTFPNNNNNNLNSVSRAGSCDPWWDHSWLSSENLPAGAPLPSAKLLLTCEELNKPKVKQQTRTRSFFDSPSRVTRGSKRNANTARVDDSQMVEDDEDYTGD